MSATFGERLSKLLNEKNMKQLTLAQRAGVTEAAISHYIKGDRIPRASVMARIADTLGTTSEFLMNGTASDSKGEITHAKRLIARNVTQMTKEEKMEIMSILLGEEESDS
ncbi:MAG: helix-turn-helix transcriptional regulator [Firmicutes bacterium]|nr:helix-turn-helix transcriptional regulator [Bacillota bacterium]